MKEAIVLQNKGKEEKRELCHEIMRLKGINTKTEAKYNQLKERELALQMANRLLADVAKIYADREATMFTTLRNLWLNYRPASEEKLPEASVDLDA